MTLGLMLGFLALVSFLLVRRGAYLYKTEVMAFQVHIHIEEAMRALSDEEHDALHDKLERYMLRLFGSIIAMWVGVLTGALAYGFTLYGAEFGWLGFTSIFAFSFILANFTLNTELVNWIQQTEGDIFQRIVKKDSDASQHKSLREYLRATGDKRWAEEKERLAAIWMKGQEMQKSLQEFLVAEGYDEKNDYESTDEKRAELIALIARVEDKMMEKYPELRRENQP